MKVGTDAMLLGSWAEPPETGQMLDIGTGCGVLALMMAQRSQGNIDAIDLDEASSEEAENNFRQSPWASRLRVIRTDIREYAREKPAYYDFIISNPPFFNRSLKSHQKQRNMARHELCLNYRELAETVVHMLTPGGRFSMVATVDGTAQFRKEAISRALHPSGFLRVRSRPGTDTLRIISEWSFRLIPDIQTDMLTIMNGEGTYTEDYLALTRDYHHFNC